MQDRGGLPGTPPTFRGPHPSRIPCCPGSKSEGAGRAAAGEGQEAAQRGFLQGPKGLAWEGRVRRKGAGGRAPSNSAGLCPGGGGLGMQTANGGTGSKSQTTEGQLCPALDSPPAGSSWPPLATQVGWPGRGQQPRASHSTDEPGQLPRGGGRSRRTHRCPDPLLSPPALQEVPHKGTRGRGPAFQESREGHTP